MSKPTLPRDEPPDLWPEIERRLAEPRSVQRSRRPLVATVVALVVFAASGVLLWRAFEPAERPHGPATDPLDAISRGWSRLPDPPEVRDGAAFVWTGSELLAWGGCEPHVEDSCTPTSDGYAFDPSTATWQAITPAPEKGDFPRAIWTGTEAVFLSLTSGDQVGGVAYDPESETWRTIAVAPIEPRFGVVTVWTGSRIFVWGGGERARPVTDGALYDPGTDTWAPTALSPIALNAASGVWTGREVIVFGSLLDNGNRASTDVSVGAAYDPASDSWRELPPSDLSPQAISTAWVGDRMLAWDYETFSQEYDASADTWTRRSKMPLDFSECYPDSVEVDGRVFAFFCGQAALYDPRSLSWQEIHGGMLDVEIWSDAYERSVKVWRFASLVPAGEVAFLAAHGITLDDRGVACYGCSGSPTSLWAYRPPSGESVEPAGDLVYHAPFIAGGSGWYTDRSDPAPERSATRAWASTEPIAPADVRLGAAIPPETIAALPPDGIVVTALATPWERDPSQGPWPEGTGPFDLNTARARGPVAEEPSGDYAVYEMYRHGVLVRVYFGSAVPSPDVLARAQAELDTLQPPPVCPLPAEGGYGATLNVSEARPGQQVTISGPMPFGREDGSYDATSDGAMIAWWNAAESDWPYLAEFSTTEPSPAMPGSELLRLGEGGRASCSFSITFAVPNVPTGEYPITVIQEGPDSAALAASLTLGVTSG
jgi:hypothetical protein